MEEVSHQLQDEYKSNESSMMFISTKAKIKRLQVDIAEGMEERSQEAQSAANTSCEGVR